MQLISFLDQCAINKHKVSTAYGQAGFALASVLWLLAGLTILAAMISQSNQVLAERVAALRAWSDGNVSFVSTRSDAIYWLSTTLPNEKGYGFGQDNLRVDGSPYKGTGKDIIQVQDVRGLLSLNLPDRTLWQRFLVDCASTSQDKLVSLLDALEDYQEPGKLKRLNGAKDFEYSSAGMPPPRGAPLLSENELWRVYGWAELRQTWELNNCFEDVSIYNDGNLNLNTATPGALVAYGVSKDVAERVVQDRADGNYALTNSLSGAQDSKSFMGMQGTRTPSAILRVTQSMPNTSWALRYEFKLKTDADGVPWVISNPRKIPPVFESVADKKLEWPAVKPISEKDKNAITQPILPF